MELVVSENESLYRVGVPVSRDTYSASDKIKAGTFPYARAALREEGSAVPESCMCDPSCARITRILTALSHLQPYGAVSLGRLGRRLRVPLLMYQPFMGALIPYMRNAIPPGVL